MTETIISWRVPGLFAADPTKCHAEILEIGEEVKPQQVVDKARDESTELHKCFDWDDTSAAEKYRIYQARHVIGGLKMIVTEKGDDNAEEPVQFRVLMKNDNSRDSGYKLTTVMMRNEDEYQKLLEQAKAELRAFKQKYKCLTELRDIIDLIDF